MLIFVTRSNTIVMEFTIGLDNGIAVDFYYFSLKILYIINSLTFFFP